MHPGPGISRLARIAGLASLLTCGCEAWLRQKDADIAAIIAQRQVEALQRRSPTAIVGQSESIPRPASDAFRPTPTTVAEDIPHGFEGPPPQSAPASSPTSASRSAPATEPSASFPATAPASMRAAGEIDDRRRQTVFTLTDAFAYAQRHRRQYQSAKEDLYLAALSLTLERHLWTPQFASELRGVYGNFGEVTDFDQATRFVADLSVAQRLPYGGQFTAAMLATLIRDVKRSITAQESGQISLGLDVPLLRGAGAAIAQEDLIQLERELTYAVRDFERFRRQQLVDVALRYFDLLQSKQQVLDAVTSVKQAEYDYERSLALQSADETTILDTGRAEQRLLSERNRLAILRESFRAQGDRFKIFIGMPIDEPMGIEDLQTIGGIEALIQQGQYPVLRMPPAAEDEERSLAVAVSARLDLMNLHDQIEDAKRGVAIAKNALLPDLDWNSSLVFDTDPAHYNVGGYASERATWRTELILSMNDRFAERNRLRSAVIDVRRAQRVAQERVEQVRADVREAVNQIRLQEQLLEIQARNLDVADKQRDFAGIQFEEGLIDNRDKIEAEDAYVQALNQLNQAKTDRWAALLNFRLATDTLRIDEDGESTE